MELNTTMSLKETLEMLFYDAMRNNPWNPEALPAVPFVVSPPGAGKTKMLEAKVKAVDWAILTVHLSTKTIEEMTGLPQFHKIVVNGEKVEGTRWTFPDMITELMELSEKHKGVILFMDDFHLASPENQKFCFQLFTDYSLKGYDLPRNTHIMLAGNPGARAGAKTMLSAITNRVAFYNVVADFEDWRQWAMKHSINPIITTFLAKKSNLKFFHEDENSKEPWGSPRSWHKFSLALDSSVERTSDNVKLPEVMFRAGGHVGPEGGREFSMYYELYSKIDTSAVFDRKNFKFKTDSTNMFIFTMAMAYEYIDRYMTHKEDTKGDKKLKDLIGTFSKLASSVAKADKDMSIVMMKEVAEMANTYDAGMIVDVLDDVDKNDHTLFEAVIKMTKEIKST